MPRRGRSPNPLSKSTRLPRPRLSHLRPPARYSPARGKDPCVSGCVDEKDHGAKNELHLTSEVLGVHNRNQVVLDEAAFVAGFPGKLAPADLERRERTDPARELDQTGSRDGWHVEPGEPRPAGDGKAAKDREEDEGAVKHDHEIGEQAIRHLVETTLLLLDCHASRVSRGRSRLSACHLRDIPARRPLDRLEDVGATVVAVLEMPKPGQPGRRGTFVRVIVRTIKYFHRGGCTV